MKSAIFDLMSSSDIMGGILDDLAFATSCDSSRPEYVVQNNSINIDEIVQSILYSKLDEFREANEIAIDYVIENVPSCIISDEKLVSRSLYHLISNAVMYAKFGGKVKILITADHNAPPSTKKFIGEESRLKIKVLVVNDTTFPMDVAFVRSKLKNYLGASISFLSVLSDENELIDLAKDEGLGLGVGIAGNMIKCLQSELKLEATDKESSFWFSFRPHSVVSKRGALFKPTAPTGSMKSFPLTSPRALIHRRPVDAIIIHQPDFVNLPIILPSIQRGSPGVLVVDDSKVCRKVAATLLNKLGYFTEEAVNGKNACAILATSASRFCAVLMDLRMPVMDGIEAIRYIRDALNLSIPIIVVSAELTDLLSKAINYGATAAIGKPFNLDALRKQMNLIQPPDPLVDIEITQMTTETALSFTLSENVILPNIDAVHQFVSHPFLF